MYFYYIFKLIGDDVPVLFLYGNMVFLVNFYSDCDKMHKISKCLFVIGLKKIDLNRISDIILKIHQNCLI